MAALKHLYIFFHIKRRPNMNNLYMSEKDIEQALQDLTPAEFRLYNKLFHSAFYNPTVEFYSTESLAKELGVAVSTIANAKSGLKAKGYAQIVSFKDEQGHPCLRVIIGKEHMALYAAGIKASMSDPKQFKEITTKYPILDTSLSLEARRKLVEQINQEYSEKEEENGEC